MSYKVNSLKSQPLIGRMTDADRSRGIEETIEILEAQVESLELERCYLSCEARESKQLTLTQVEELAKTFLATEKPLKDALVELLTAVYNIPVKLDDLTQINRFCTDSEIELAHRSRRSCLRRTVEVETAA